jgi:hypothetical protein
MLIKTKVYTLINDEPLRRYNSIDINVFLLSRYHKSGFFFFCKKKKLMKGPRNIEMEEGIRGAGQTFNHKCPNQVGDSMGHI